MMMLEQVRGNFDLWFIVAGILVVIDALLFVSLRRRFKELSPASGSARFEPSAENTFDQYNKFIFFRRFLDFNDGRLVRLGYSALIFRIAYCLWMALGVWLIFGVRQ